MLSLPLFLFAFLVLWVIAILPLRPYLRPEDAPFLFTIAATGILAATASFFYVVVREPEDMTTMDYIMRDVKVLGATALSMFGLSALLYRVARRYPHETKTEE